ncbi:hypothetical protein JXVLWARM_CDS_0066 [Burkholderia phage Bm1]
MFPSIVERAIVAVLLALSITLGVAAVAFYGQRQEARKDVATLKQQLSDQTSANKQLAESLDEQSAAVSKWRQAADDAEKRAAAADLTAQQKQAQYTKAAGVIAAQKPTADTLQSFKDLRATFEGQTK